MSIKFVQWYKHKDLEVLASKIRQEYKCEIPVDIDYIAGMMGIEILDMTKLKELFGLFGLLAKIEGKFTIFVEKGTLKTTNYSTNFTIAEELAHFILHRKHFQNVNSIEKAVSFYADMISEETNTIMEFNAKYLAGAILIPKEDLVWRATGLYEKNKKLFAKILKDGNENICDAIIDSISSSLSDIYRVPDGQVAKRLRRTEIGFKKFLAIRQEECKGK